MSSSAQQLDLLTVGQAGKEVTANDLFGALSPALLYARRPAFSIGLTWAYYGGEYNGIEIPNGTVTLNTNSPNYIQADKATGAVSTNTTGFGAAADFLPLYFVLTDSVGRVSVFVDKRQAIGAGGGTTLPYGIGGGTHAYGGAVGSLIVGGTGHTLAANADYSLVVGGVSNRVDAVVASIVGGQTNRIFNGADFAYIGGGALNQVTINSVYGCIAGGNQNKASGNGAAVGGGQDNEATGLYAVVPGGYRGTTRGVNAGLAHASSLLSATVGATQHGVYQLSALTNSASPVLLRSQNNFDGLLLADNSAYQVKARVVAIEPATGHTASFEFDVLVQNFGGSTVLDATPSITTRRIGAGAAAWSISVNTTPGFLQVFVTGDAGKTIRWHSVHDCVELMSA